MVSRIAIAATRRAGVLCRVSGADDDKGAVHPYLSVAADSAYQAAAEEVLVGVAVMPQPQQLSQQASTFAGISFRAPRESPLLRALIDKLSRVGGHVRSAGSSVLQAKHIEGLAAFFHVSPAAFFARRVPLLA
jgi:hypothetical protein